MSNCPIVVAVVDVVATIVAAVAFVDSVVENTQAKLSQLDHASLFFRCAIANLQCYVIGFFVHLYSRLRIHNPPMDIHTTTAKIPSFRNVNSP